MQKKKITGSSVFKAIAAGLFSMILLAAPFTAKAEESLPEVKAGDVLCFGTPDETSGFDGKWLVLDPEHTNTGEDGMFLVSLNLVGNETGGSLLYREIGDVSVSFSDRGEAYAASHPGVLDYQGSDIQKWCEAFPKKYLSDTERQALIPTYRSDEAIAVKGFEIPLPGAAAGTVDFDPAENVLMGDTVFILSVEEATNSGYGFTDDKSRVAFYQGKAANYWLRSPHIPTFPLDVGLVFYFGSVMDYPVNARSMYELDTYARPACNLDSKKIADLEQIAVSGETAVWRVSFSGGEHNDRTYDPSLPKTGSVMDIQSMIRYGIILIGILIIAVPALIILLIVRGVRKRKKARQKAQTD